MFNQDRVNLLDKITRFLILFSVGVAAFLPFLSKINYKIADNFFACAFLALLILPQIIANYYKNKRNELKISDTIQAIAEILVYSTMLGALSYIAAYFSLSDKTIFLSGLDSFIGFDWLKIYSTTESNPFIKQIFYYSYLSMTPQYFCLIIIIVFFGNRSWLRVFVNSFVILAFVTILISTLIPAVEADVFFKVTKSTYDGQRWTVPDLLQAEHYLNLNNKTMTEIPLSSLQGIVSFPSFHTIAGLILVMCFSRIKWLRFPFLVLNILLIAATPSIGGHYLVDTIAGAVIALLGMAAILKFVQPGVPLFSVSFRRTLAKPIPYLQKT